MGQLIDGVWHDTQYDTKSTGGKFQRSASAFRNWLTADGTPGQTGEGETAAKKDRYHLYVSLACPWAHRTLILRKQGLEPFISRFRCASANAGKTAGPLTTTSQRQPAIPCISTNFFISSIYAPIRTTFPVG